MQFKLPELGEGVHEGELVKWRVKPGDQVAYDQPLCEILTDKATVEIPSAFKGKVQEIHAKEGQVVTVGQLMLTIEGVGAAASAPGSAPSVAPALSNAPLVQATQAAPAALSVAAPARGLETRVPAAPSTRRMAREQGVDLSQVSPSGPSGRVMKEDVERWISGAGAVAAGPATTQVPRTRKGAEERIPMRGLRKKIAEKMHLSKSKAAHFTYVEEADATELVAFRAMAKAVGAKAGVKVTFLPFIMKAMVASLRHFPILNSSYDEEHGEIVIKHYYNIGLSIQTDDGLTAPIIKGVESKTILELAREIEQLVDRARKNKLTQDDFKDGTITLTNAGSIGGVFATPVINYPEVAILGFNKIARKPVVMMKDGKEEITIRDWTYFSISLDHRVVDGAIAAEFMKRFVSYVENPSLLLLDSI